MAERFVHQLEAVEVDREQRKLAARAGGRGDCLGGALGEERAVGEPGERVARGELLDARLGELARGDVGRHAAVAAPAALGIGERQAAHRLPDDAARLGHDTVHKVAERPAFAAVVGEPLANGALFAQRNEIPGAPAEELAPRIAEQRLHALGKIAVAPLGVRFPDVFARHGGDVAEALVGRAHRGFRAFAGIDIGHHARHARRAAVCIALGDTAHRVQPFPVALARAHAQLHVVLLHALQRAHQRRARLRQVLRMQQPLELHAARDRRRALVAEEAHPAVARVELIKRQVVMPLGEVAAVQRELEPRLGLRQARLGTALLGDVASHTAVAAKRPRGVVVRLPGDDMHLTCAALIGARDLEIEERQLPFQPLEVRLERARVDLDARDLPEVLAIGRRVAKERRHRSAAREPDDAVALVGLPEPVGGELGEASQPLLVRARARELALAPAGDEHHGEVDDGRRDGGEEQRVAERIQAAPSRTGGATLSTSSIVVTPAPTFIAPLMRSGFMPSLNACSRRRPSSGVAPSRPLNPGVSTSVS